MDKEAIQNSYNVMATAGVYPVQKPGTVHVGLSVAGRQMFSNQNLMNSQDPNAGHQYIGLIQSILQPIIGTLTPQDHESLNELGSKTANNDLIATLDNFAAKNDHQSFVDHALSVISPNKNPSAVASATAASHTWTKLSPAQKGLALAGTGIMGHKFQDGTDLFTKPIITEKPNVPGLKVGEGLHLLSSGVNIYPLVKNWNQYTALTKITGGDVTSKNVISLANQSGLLGHGLTGAEAPNTSVDSLKGSGWSPSPQFGPGAVWGNSKNKVPNGFSVLGSVNGQTIAAPNGTVPIAKASTLGSLAGTAAGNHGLSSSAFDIYNKWGNRKEYTNGISGGSQLASSLVQWSKDNPFAFSAVIGTALHRNTKDVPEDNRQYVLGMAGAALNRLKSGTADKATDMLGTAFAKDFPKGNLFENLKKAYTKEGISSKADAYQLANQGYAEGRFDDMDLVAMHQVFNTVFDPPSEFSLNKLLSGKGRVSEIIHEVPGSSATPLVRKNEPLFKYRSKEEAIAANKARYQQVQ